MSQPAPDPTTEAGWRLYLLLALFDAREPSWLGDIVRAAREGYERCDFEEDAWAKFDRLWDQHDSRERIDACNADLLARLMGW